MVAVDVRTGPHGHFDAVALREQELFELDYAISALAAMITKWAEDGMTVPPERMAALFDRCIPPFCWDRPDA